MIALRLLDHGISSPAGRGAAIGLTGPAAGVGGLGPAFGPPGGFAGRGGPPGPPGVPPQGFQGAPGFPPPGFQPTPGQGRGFPPGGLSGSCWRFRCLGIGREEAANRGGPRGGRGGGGDGMGRRSATLNDTSCV
ncbi:hypothetical protein EJ08DRAFT_701436 [Tothia fuscella]|uniref:Uncharacterized protein n=1 Tax=Tothia fuscella TaxID=1048955 RepID=A0A9P4TUW9_9PEZI|nr:hypothetical protein EJ08DRAFT_701436 [Tothia fuscella]